MNTTKKNILVIHGLWAGSWVWEIFISKVSNTNFIFYNITLPRTKNENGDSFNQWTKQIIDISKKNQINTIIAHSSGCLIALKVAEKCPNLELILINPAPFRGLFGPIRIRSLIPGIKLLIQALFNQSVKIDFKSFQELGLNETEIKKHRGIWERLVPEPSTLYKNIVFPGTNIDLNVHRRLRGLVIASHNDLTIHPKLSEKIAGKLGFDFSQIEGDHLVIMDEKHVLLHQIVENWLNKQQN